jgi:galactose mutarotase-like enzyme
MRTSGRGELLIPWPNRLENVHYEFDGQTRQVPLNERGLGTRSTASPVGFVVDREREPDRVVLTTYRSIRLRRRSGLSRLVVDDDRPRDHVL